MAARYVDKQASVTTDNCKNLPDAAGICYDSTNGLLKYNDAGTLRTVVNTDEAQTLTNKTITGSLATVTTETVTATNVITAAESGSVFFLNSATEFVSTLPAAAAGLRFEFYVTAAPSGADYTIVTDSSANIIVGHVVSSDLNAAGDADFEITGGDTISFVSAAAVKGDRVTLVCDGTNWYATCFCSVVGGITITTAS